MLTRQVTVLNIKNFEYFKTTKIPVFAHPVEEGGGGHHQMCKIHMRLKNLKIQLRVIY